MLLFVFCGVRCFLPASRALASTDNTCIFDTEGPTIHTRFLASLSSLFLSLAQSPSHALPLPSIHRYQHGMPDEPHNDDRDLLPKDTTCTGMVAGSLALAARSPAMVAHFPAADLARWLAKAEAAWGFLERNADKPALW
jgi:hypothetical protein